MSFRVGSFDSLDGDAFWFDGKKVKTGEHVTLRQLFSTESRGCTIVDAAVTRGSWSSTWMFVLWDCGGTETVTELDWVLDET